MSTSVSAVDLFCGIGGLTHGLAKAGIPVVAGIDVDERCRYAYEKNNCSRFIQADIRNLTAAEVLKLYRNGEIRVLVGCAPCQPFSRHTQKNKDRTEDSKWRLLYFFARLVSDVSPDIVSMENVPETAKHAVFTDFVATLETLGYHVWHKSIYCPNYGIPQTRTRLVLLASKLGKIEIIPRTHDRMHYPTARDAIKTLEPIGDGEVSRGDPLHRAYRLSSLNRARIRQSRPGGTWSDWDENLRAPCHRRDSGKSYSAVYARMMWDAPAPTVTTQFYSFGTGRFGHPEQDRALSLREGALLQTFPDYYEFLEPGVPPSFKRIGMHIGNAVPVRLGVVIGESILRHLESVRHDR